MSTASDEERADLPTGVLCFHYASGDALDDKIRRELKRRNVFTAKEWNAVERHKIFIGMSKEAFHCSWPRDPRVFITGYDPDVSNASKEGHEV